MKKEQVKLRHEMLIEVEDGAIVNRYHAILFCYCYFKYDGKRSIPFWAIDLIDDLCFEGHLLP